MRQDFILHLADNNLILAQRLTEWCGHGPVLEQDIALSNMALDLLGQAHLYYDYAAELHSETTTADALAMLRHERDYKNLLLVELPNGHFGDTIARQFFYDVFHLMLLEQLCHATDQNLQAIAIKSLKEVKYHLRWSSEWVIRLGDGTPESHNKMQEAVDRVLPYVGEMFEMADYQNALIGNGEIGDPRDFRAKWTKHVQDIMQRATLSVDLDRSYWHAGGKNGMHTEYMGYILAELQYLQRAYPNLQW